MSHESALKEADLDYQEANIDLKIQEYLTTCEVQSVKEFVSFIMATNISLFILTYIEHISHHVCAESMHLDISVPSQSLSKIHA